MQGSRCRPPRPVRLADDADQRVAVLARHPDVGDDDRRTPRRDPLPGLRPPMPPVHVRAGAAQHRLQQRARILLVVHDQDVDAVDATARGSALAGCAARLAAEADRQDDRERRSLAAPLAVGADGPAVQLDEVPRDRQAQSEAAVDARGRAVSLAEAIEHEREELGRDARCRCPPLRFPSTRRPAHGDVLTRPPRGVNFSAFDSRLPMTCCRRAASPSVGTRPGGMSRSSVTPRGVPADGRTRSPRGRSRRRRTARRSKCILPLTTREVSSRSSTSCACACALRSIASMARAAVAGSSPARFSSCDQPSTALSGVRSSCETVPRNSSLRRFDSCNSRYRRALSSAIPARSASSDASATSACV